MNDRIILVFLAGILLYIIASMKELKNDLARTQRTLNKIAKQVGVANGIDDELKRLILEGKQVEAVKKYRITTGADLIEAKKHIDSLDKSD